MKRIDPVIAVPSDLGLRRLFPDVGADFEGHCAAVKMHLMRHRDSWCWFRSFRLPTYEKCSPALISHKHEAIRRGMVMGWPRDWRVLIHVPYNCLILCDAHHGTEYEPKLETVADWMLDYYGSDYIRWLRSLPFKGPNPLAGWLERRGLGV